MRAALEEQNSDSVICSKNILTQSKGLVYWGLTPQQQPGSYQGGEMMMKSVFWLRKPEYPEETTQSKGSFLIILYYLYYFIRSTMTGKYLYGTKVYFYMDRAVLHLFVL